MAIRNALRRAADAPLAHQGPRRVSAAEAVALRTPRRHGKSRPAPDLDGRRFRLLAADSRATRLALRPQDASLFFFRKSTIFFRTAAERLIEKLGDPLPGSKSVRQPTERAGYRTCSERALIGLCGRRC